MTPPRRPFREFDDAYDAESMRLARRVIRGLTVDVRHLVLAPGSRSAPIGYAALEAEQMGALTLHMRIDERSAAFTAVGMAMATGEPAAVATTSGTATGNLVPAVMEADLAGVPLVVITADRPEDLHGTGANQTLDQQGMFGSRVRDDLHLEQGQIRLEPVSGDDLLAAEHQVGLLVRTAVTRTPKSAPGPVHLNVAFADPLIPAATEKPPGRTTQRWARHPVRPPRARTAAPLSAGSEELSALLDQATAQAGQSQTQHTRTVFVCGDKTPDQAIQIARALGHPMLAEPTSGARFSDLGPVQGYRLILEQPEDSAAGQLVADIQTVVVAGRPTLTRPVQRLIRRAGVEVVQFAPLAEPWHDHRLPRRIVSDADQLISLVGTAESGWSQSWEQLGLRAQGVIDATLRQQDGVHGSVSSIRAAQCVAEHVRGPLFLGSSSVIRDVDLAAALVRSMPPAASSENARIYAGRGVAGIDGNLSMASGIAVSTGQRVTALVGDLTFLHDINALLVPATERAPDLDVVVINDAGGAIFDQLEHGQVGQRQGRAADVERLFGTPQAVDISALAAAYGHQYRRAETIEQLTQGLAHPDDRIGMRIIEVPTDRRRLAGIHEAIRRVPLDLH